MVHNLLLKARVLSFGLMAFAVGTASSFAASTINSGTFSVGSSVGDNNNFVAVTNLIMTSGSVLVGAGQGLPGGNNNVVIITNSSLHTTQQSYIGFSSSGNTVTLLDNSSWDLNGGTVTIGTTVNGSGANHVSNNVLSILSGAVISNGIVRVGFTNGANGPVVYPTYNSFIVSNGGLAVLNGLNVGSQLVNASGNISNNFAYISNITVAAGLQLSSGNINIGNYGTGNTGILDHVMWNGNNGTIEIGLSKVGPASANDLTLQGGSIITNFAVVGIGRFFEGGSGTNSLSALNVLGQGTRLEAVTVIAGGTDKSGSTATPGGSSNNFLNVLSGGTLVSTNLYVGLATKNNGNAGVATTWLVQKNQAWVSNATVTNRGNLVVGYALATAGNSGSLDAMMTSNNFLTVSEGGTVWAPTVVVGGASAVAGTASAIANVLAVTNGGNLITSSLTVGQVSQLGTATLNANNNLLLLRDGNLTVNGTLLVGSGNSGTATGNAFQLEGASTAVVQRVIISDSNTLTFHGGFLQVSSLLSNGNASALVIGDGVQSATLKIVGGHEHYVVSGLTINSNAKLTGDGILDGDVVGFGVISPAGSLTITGNLSLAVGSETVIGLSGFGAGVGTNDMLHIGGTFMYGGTLTITNTTGFGYAAGESFTLFTFNSQTGDFNATNLPDLTAFGLGWDASQLKAAGVLSIVAIPEPSTMVLLSGGLLALMAVSRRRRRS